MPATQVPGRAVAASDAGAAMLEWLDVETAPQRRCRHWSLVEFGAHVRDLLDNVRDHR